VNRIYFTIAGIINLLTALLHLIGGQIDLVNPLLESNLTLQQKGELTAAWHIVTILLFVTTYIIIRTVITKEYKQNHSQLKSIAILYVFSGIPFIVVSIWFGIFAPQWILLMPIGILILLGRSKTELV